MLLELKNVDAGYGFLQVLREISFQIDKGEYVCLIGPNGAGKSTTLKTITGLLSPSAGQILFNGEDIGGTRADLVARKGISYVSEEMNLFTNMTVHENLLLGAYAVKDKEKTLTRLDFVYDLFPRLLERKGQLSGTMSGGERKMLAIARGLMSHPKMILVDEPSFGLAPQMTESVFEALKYLNQTQKLTILVVEQNVTQTLGEVERGYVLEHGCITMDGTSEGLSGNEHIRRAYLGL